MTVSDALVFLRENPGYLKWGDERLSEKLGLSISLTQDLKSRVKLDRAQATENTSTSEGGEDPALFEGSSAYEQYLLDMGIDPDSVASVKYWQTSAGEPRFSVVVKAAAQPVEDVEALLKDTLSGYSLPPVPRPADVMDDKCVILNMYDAHIDKISIPSEVYNADGYRTIEDNIQVLRERFDEMVNLIAPHMPEQIILPVGSDFWNSNGPYGTTKNGTPQPVLAPYEEAFKKGAWFYLECIQKLLMITERVIVVTIKGNHDEDPVFHLGVALEMAFMNEPRVEMHTTRHQRKYLEYGIWGWGFAHGDKEKKKLDRIPLWFAQEAKDIWYRTQMREMILGDIHHKEEYRFQSGGDEIGVYVQFLRSAAGTDQWHSDNGWIGIPKSLEASVYHKTSGRKTTVSVSWK